MADKRRVREVGFSDPKDRRIIKYVRSIAGVQTVVKTSRVKPNLKVITYRDQSFPFDMNAATYRQRNRFYYFVDIEKGQLAFKGSKLSISPELMNATFKRQIAKQFLAVLETPASMASIIMILLALGAGVFAGIVIGNYMPIG